MNSPENFGYEPDENGDIQFRTVYSDFMITNFEEYMQFVHSLMTEVARPNIMPIYRAGEDPQQR